MTTTALLRVKVTQDHIARGERQQCTNCPIAIALREAGHPADVYTTEVWFDNVGPAREMKASNLPVQAATFVNAFDNGNEVQPFEFDLEVPVEE